MSLSPIAPRLIFHPYYEVQGDLHKKTCRPAKLRQAYGDLFGKADGDANDVDHEDCIAHVVDLKLAEEMLDALGTPHGAPIDHGVADTDGDADAMRVQIEIFYHEWEVSVIEASQAFALADPSIRTRFPDAYDGNLSLVAIGDRQGLASLESKLGLGVVGVYTVQSIRWHYSHRGI